MRPTRRCVGCRQSVPKGTLLRVAAVGDRVVVDREAVLPGRGAYVHPSAECVTLSVDRNAWPGALKKTTRLDLTELDNWEATASHTEMAERLMDLS